MPAEPLALFPVRKKCYECGLEWEGHSFVTHPVDTPPLPGMCARCIGRESARVAALMAHGPGEAVSTMPELQPPRRAEDADDVL